MTPDEDEYLFVLDAYSPATIPMGRLAEYMASLAGLFGNPAYVHFRGLEKGSTGVGVRVEREAIPKVAQRISGGSLPDAPQDVRSAYRAIDDLLRADNAVGRLDRKQSGAKAPAQVLRFPGRERVRPEKMGPFSQPLVIDGRVFRVGGRDLTAHALIEDAEGRVWTGEMTRDLAVDLAKRLYQVMRFDGEARWERLEEGAWEMKSFKIRSFIPLPDDTLTDAFGRLRTIEGGTWDAALDLLNRDRDDKS